MMDQNEIRAKVTNKVDVIIRANQPNIDLDEPFYAINWFSTKTEWIYHLYNALAGRSVRKIGGTAFFKGKVTETILDDLKTRRDLILIVRYPGGQNFKQLMESTYFKMVSIFRVLSVKKFSFGFTHKLEVDNDSKKENEFYYAIHHFKSKETAVEAMDKIKEFLPNNITIKYAGYVIATLNSQEKNKPIQQIPNLMDGLFIFQSNDKKSLGSLFASDDYKTFLETFESSHISLLNRIAV
jgi:hypothetical protein